MTLSPASSRDALDDPVLARFGAPSVAAFEFDSASPAGLTALSPTPDVENANTDVPGCYYAQNNTATDAWCGRYRAAPAAPFTVVALVADTDIRTDTNQAGVFVGEATPGVLEMMTLTTIGASIRAAIAYRFTNPTTFSATLATGQLNLTPPLWLAIRVNSATNVDYLYSYGGRVWIELVAARNPAITIGSCGIAINAENVLGSGSAFDYLRIYSSALAFPGSG